MTNFTATFTIDSATGEATGTSTFNSATPTSGCYQDPSTFGANALLNYQAKIHTSQGNYTDQGTAEVNVAQASGTQIFGEAFTSSQTQPTLIEPTSKQQCVNGGYRNFPQFKNQGQCVAYVENSQGSS